MMRKNLALTVILALIFIASVSSCAPSSPPESSAGLTLTVTQPADNSIISADEVEVRGHTSPGAVVSVNDEVTTADAQGIFATTLTLEEGPNIIEVVASDSEGNEARINLTVTLVKGG